jgi:hypothetical protein
MLTLLSYFAAALPGLAAPCCQNPALQEPSRTKSEPILLLAML